MRREWKRAVLVLLLGGGLMAGGAMARVAQAQALVTPQQLAKELKAPKPPIVIHVGFAVLYRGGHIPGALHVDEATSPAGKAALIKTISRLPRDRDIVLYCGCCPWQDCPNVQPAYAIAKAIRGKQIKLLNIPQDFDHDWGSKGYPVQR